MIAIMAASGMDCGHDIKLAPIPRGIAFNSPSACRST
jgi:hypothetical protein